MIRPSILLSLIVWLVLSFSSCFKDSCQEVRTYQIYEYYTTPISELRVPIQPEGPRDLCTPGNIYYYQQYLLIAEQNTGIHIIDNRHPSAPIPLTFLPIAGTADMAINNGYLYANQYMDLVTFDIRNPSAPVYSGRSENVFSDYYRVFFDDSSQEQVVASYLSRDSTVTISCDHPNWNDDFFAWDNSAGGGRLEALSSGSGIGGSLARFTISQGYLYTLRPGELGVFDLQQPTQPQLKHTAPIANDAETIFPYQDNLFLGASSGMHIYSVSDPLNPTHLSTFEHARACDPVVVTGDRAYVTLRDGNTCQNFTNQLEVLDVSNLHRPRLLATHPMYRPIGLSVDGDHLFICDDYQGVKVFDRREDHRILANQVAGMGGFQATDIITLTDQKVALVIGKNGLRQYLYSDITLPRLLSEIPICEP